jgi:hypothetical protein
MTFFMVFFINILRAKHITTADVWKREDLRVIRGIHMDP